MSLQDHLYDPTFEPPVEVSYELVPLKGKDVSRDRPLTDNDPIKSAINAMARDEHRLYRVIDLL
jgi:hypothetical protein